MNIVVPELTARDSNEWSDTTHGESKHMRRSLLVAEWVAIFGVSAVPAFADGITSTCSLTTLHGTYAFSGTGTDNGVPYSSSGRETYDGQGHIKYSQLWDESGVTYTYTGTGTYTMSSDCVATAAYGLENHWTYFVAPDGNVFYFNNNNNTGVMSAGHEERISRGLLF
jgi:hypothetical protein